MRTLAACEKKPTKAYLGYLNQALGSEEDEDEDEEDDRKSLVSLEKRVVDGITVVEGEEASTLSYRVGKPDCQAAKSMRK